MDTPDRSSSSATRAVQDVWDVYREELGVVPEEVVLALGNAVSRSFVDDFWAIWCKSAEEGLFRAYSKAGGPLKLAVLPFLVEVCYEFVTGVWEEELLAAGDPVGYIELARVMSLMCIVLSTSLTLPSLLYYSFAGASSL